MKGMHDLASVTEKLRMLCSRREYCSSDILKKAIRALDGDSEGASQILEILINEKYIDDLRYACAYARDKASIAGWGTAKIRFMLSAKGVARDVIDMALLEIDESKADHRFKKLMLNKSRSLKDDSQKRVKLLRFAMGRGYSYHDASSIIDDIIDNDEGL